MERNNYSLLLNLRVLDTPPNSRHGSSAVPRDEIVSLLMAKVNAGKVNITLGKAIITPSIRIPPTTSCSASVQPTMTSVSMVTNTVFVSMTTTTTSVAISMATNTVSVSMTTSYPTNTPAVPCGNNDSKEDSSSLSSGAVIGLSIGMFVAGAIVGLISTVFTCWIMRSGVKSRSGRYSTSSYSKQRDDIVI